MAETTLSPEVAGEAAAECVLQAFSGKPLNFTHTHVVCGALTIEDLPGHDVRISQVVHLNPST
jgi:hypothetical protein